MMAPDDHKLDPDEVLEDQTEDLVEEEVREDAGEVLEQRIAELEIQLQAARDRELRATADYQNLTRRTFEDRNKMAKLASREVIESVLQPLDHLLLAKNQLKDKGLDMVYQQFMRVLEDQGLEEIEVLGKKFDLETMEVVDKVEAEDKKDIERVMKVTQPGYRLNGEVIRHAKVVVGE